MSVPADIFGRRPFQCRIPGGWSSRGRTPTCARVTVRTALQCVVSKHLHGICFGMNFFPSAGTLHYSTGALTLVGSVGYSWLSMSWDMNSCFLSIGTSFVYQGPTFRSSGFSLRCVQEITWGGFLPVCGFPERYDGSAGVRWYGW